MKRAELRELAQLFLRLGATSFGGPAVHVAMMEEAVVRRRKWLSAEEFLDLLGAVNLIPGPNSTELAIHVGHRRAGLPGLVVAGVAFIAPAVLIVVAVAWGYVRFGALPEAQGLLYGVKPVIIAVVLQALVALGRAALRTRSLALVAALAIAAGLAGLNELAILVAAGASSLALHALRRGESHHAVALGAAGGTTLAAPLAAPFSLPKLFLVFVKIGSVLFGSGYVLLAFLRADLVDRLHWLTESQLLDAVAVGQVTPGPVFTTATFIGYVVAGAPGAALATLGIFLPAFVFVALSAFLVPRLRASKRAGAFLDGVNVASLALMATVTAHLARAALVDPVTLVLAATSAVLLLRYRVSSAWLVVGGALIGVAARWLPS